MAAPAFNEAAGIAAVVEEWIKYLRSRRYLERFEIVICDDGSTDDTRGVLSRLEAVYPELRVVRHVVNQGAAAALTTAICHTEGEWVLLTDSDGQFPIRGLDRMLDARKDGEKAVLGVRKTKQSDRFARYGSAASGFVCNFLHGTRYRDFNSAFKLVHGPLIRAIHLEAKGLNYSTEITSKLIERQLSLAEAEIEHTPRDTGRSSARRWTTSFHRLLFVLYLGLRQWLLRLKVLQRQSA